jgi:MoxR-like ATPase/uncharacterized protein with von Willebrand factor type A (vWA) domain
MLCQGCRQENVIKGVVHATLGQSTESRALPISIERSYLPSLLDAGYNLKSLEEVGRGLESWSASLLKGVCPDDREGDCWPKDVLLFESICSTFTTMDLPRAVQRHPGLLSSVLKSIVEMSLKFEHRLEEEEKEEEEQDEGGDEDEESMSSSAPLTEEDERSMLREDLTKEIVREFQSKWAPPLGGLKVLDDLYGVDHDLLDTNSDGDQDGVGGGAGSGAGGFGLFDSVWQDVGWKVVEELQKRVKEMKELRQLIRSLGRRPSLKGDASLKLPPQILDPSAPRGVVREPLAMDDLAGTRLSNQFERMLPIDAMLLNKKTKSSKPRLLFLSKFAEGSIRSYELDGWVEDFARSRRKPWRHFQRRPTSTGGPIIVCLDTSYSMAGPREQLAKAVVLEVAQLAAKDNRPMYLLAFSGGGNLAECDLKLGPDKKSILTLLSFLAKSFRGGTDVTAPLQRAVSLLEDTFEWASSDVLLVTDGELSNPPLPPSLMEKLRMLERQRGLEVHGLVVGRRYATPQLELICTQHDGRYRVHNFLSKYDPLLSKLFALEEGGEQKDVTKLQPPISAVRSRSISPSGRSNRRSPRSPSSALFMTAQHNEGEGEGEGEGESLGGVVERAVEVLTQGLIERDAEVRLLLLACLSREHILYLGPPGCGKSELARRLGQTSGGIFFERLLTRYTAPEEVFGPLSLSSLEKDEYVRATQGYLPTASVAFLDEVFKASSSILNSLLTILNERKFDQGNKRIHVPLLTVVAASNELPESEELDALYDRFLFRRVVSPVSDAAITSLLISTATEFTPTAAALMSEKLAEEVFSQAQSIELPPAVLTLLRSLRAFLRDDVNPAIFVSDRRLKKAATALRVSALCNGRRRVSMTDCLLLQDMLWYAPEEREIVAEFIWSNLATNGDDAEEAAVAYSFLAEAIVKRLSDALSSDNKAAFNSEVAEIEFLYSAVQARRDDAARTYEELQASNNLFLDLTTNLRARQTAAPLAKVVADKYERILQAIKLLQGELRGLANFDIEWARNNAAETIRAVQDSAVWRGGFSVDDEGKGRPLPSRAAPKSVSNSANLDLGLSVREAKKSLTKDEYKEWKRLKAKETTTRWGDDDE